MSFDPNFREMSNVTAIAGEVTLFRAVIARAFNDAVGSPAVRERRAAMARQEREDSETREARVLREEARAWLLSDSVDFRRVCHWALLDPDAVRDAARRAVEASGAGPDQAAA